MGTTIRRYGFLFVLAIAAGCGSDTAPQNGQVEPPSDFGKACTSNQDCESGWCVEGADGKFCTMTCTTSCPAGMDCEVVETGPQSSVSLCLPNLDRSCAPCDRNIQCGSGVCLSLDGEGRCARSCTKDSDCAAGYACRPDPLGEQSGTFCEPITGSCACSVPLAGTTRVCQVSNNFGTCYGREICDPQAGFGACDATVPEAEICDGKDNDCNRLTDDGLTGEGAACQVTVEGIGSCPGVMTCRGAVGWTCVGPTPEAERCDFVDNDCDGQTDEDFKDAQGHWTLTENCGGCGNDCTQRIPHGVGACGGTPEVPVCMVAGCDPGYQKANDFQCRPAPDLSCQPCVSDVDCLFGSCKPVEANPVCLRPCLAESPECPTGYRCQDVDTERLCMPSTGSCACRKEDDGERRACSKTNEVGTCSGEQICHADTGWGACDARDATPEVCNGLDDDCNGATDDGIPPPTESCKATNEFGTCGGRWLCADPPDGGGVRWVCVSPTPGLELCDYLDNNCDGATDEGFKDAAGRYFGDTNCGACEVDCTTAIPHANGACRIFDEEPRCEVVACDPGYYAAGPFSCKRVEDLRCIGCQEDGDCLNPGDLCLALADGKYCGMDCGASNLHQNPEGTCPDDFQCLDLPNGRRQCVPPSNACTCLVEDLGKERTCSQTNSYGTCYGQETCDPTQGWMECTARTPATEVCNGEDDDCNVYIDDLPGRGTSCQNENAFGSCPGIQDCVSGHGDLQCVGPISAAELCNHADDDCDGLIDEDFSGLNDVCWVGQGACERVGLMRCAPDGQTTACDVVQGTPTTELCDGVDNDCDGETDEGLWALKGTACMSGTGICMAVGVHVCDPADPTAPLVCSAVPGMPEAETCNELDDDCDGQVDEDFKQNGLYTSDTACGNCYMDCTAIYAKPNATGHCVLAGPAPVCQMNCNAGAYDLNSIPDDGCEFLLSPQAIYVSPFGTDGPSCGFTPEGAGGTPCRTIAYGLTRASALGRTQVLVADGGYAENVTLVAGIDLLGGYRHDTWERHLASTATFIRGQAGAGHAKAVVASSIQLPTLFEGFVVEGANALSAGKNSYGVYVLNSSGNLKIRNNFILAGLGGPGLVGADGDSGAAGVAGGTGTNTSNIVNCVVGTAYPDRAGVAGGKGCQNPGGGTTDVSGGIGGAPVCPDTNFQSGSGSAGQNGGGAGGAGGYGHRTSGSSCTPTVGQLETGTIGTPAAASADGVGGQGCQAGQVSGTVVANEWQGTAGSAGTHGAHGRGGGGGGSGGGQRLTDPIPDTFDISGGGGGGGSGGCAGLAAAAGSPGGGSFGVFVVFTSAPASPAGIPEIAFNTISRNYGGSGGDGGNGGGGGGGGAGGVGGLVTQYSGPIFCIFGGARGGEGSRGGHGGGGGGACGGISYDVALFHLGGVAYTTQVHDNQYQVGALTPTGGGGGSGGNSSNTVSGRGTAGAAGSSGNVLGVN